MGQYADGYTSLLPLDYSSCRNVDLFRCLTFAVTGCLVSSERAKKLAFPLKIL